jgi:hypothetical protein
VVQYATKHAPGIRIVKKADLEKHLAKKVEGRMRQQAAPDRYGSAAGMPAERREQRDREKAAGLVPFAVKLPQDLVTALQALARERGIAMNDLAAELIDRALAGPEKR